MLNLPNLLTLIRIGVIPAFLALLFSQWYTAALIVFVVGGITDVLDGPLARLTGQQTSLGTYLDPLADKLLVNSSLVVLSFLGVAPAWLTMLILSRDLIITLGYVAVYFIARERMEVVPSILGKLTTFLQLLTVTVLLVMLFVKGSVFSPMSPAFQILFFLTAITTALSGLHYVYRGLLWLQKRAPSLTRLS